MTGSGHSKAALSSRAEKLSKLFNLNEKTPEEWGDRTLPAMARHQLATPLGFDLRSLTLKPPDSEAREMGLSRAAVIGIESFEDLLFHREPPLELLRLAKDFFKKRTRECQKGSAEWQAAYLFYLLAIAAGGARAQEISALTPGDLLKGIGWALEQPWVDDKTKALLCAARRRLPTAADRQERLTAGLQATTRAGARKG
ncbi:MAG: hypothetical protein ABSH34_03305 [Verrucomicrobiota bacterium]|jgi:hypothetical protein